MVVAHQQTEDYKRTLAVELARRRVRQSFKAFAKHWKFVNRETGKVHSFSDPWPGQERFMEVMEQYKWVFALKAGKLGFSELECCYDGFVLVCGQPNSRVHMFSRADLAAQDLLGYVRYGITHLPEWLRPAIMHDEAGGDTTHSLKLEYGPDDTRTIVCYASGPNVSIDQTANHAHVDELARMPFARKTWEAIASTIAPDGTCHIVTRGAGEQAFAAELWKAAKSGSSKLHPFFEPWSARPDRDALWYEEQAGVIPTIQGLKHFAPETEEDAMAGDEENDFLPDIALWDRCREDLPPLVTYNDAGHPTVSRDQVVLGVDAAVTSDCFGIVAVTRHPDPARRDQVAVRAVKLWVPPKGGHIDFSGPEHFIRFLTIGGCAAGHDKKHKVDGCEPCVAGPELPAHNVVCVVYDPYQLEDMMQRLRKEGDAWYEPFSQMAMRLKSDSALKDLIMQRRIAHDGNANLRTHIQNCAAKLDPHEDRKLRLIKKAPERKIDLAVCVSMAAYQALYLLLS